MREGLDRGIRVMLRVNLSILRNISIHMSTTGAIG